MLLLVICREKGWVVGIVNLPTFAMNSKVKFLTVPDRNVLSVEGDRKVCLVFHSQFP